MGRIKGLLNLFLIFFCALFPAKQVRSQNWSQMAREQPYYYCMSSASLKTMYFSGLMQAPATDTAKQSFESGFAQYLARTYSYHDSVACYAQSGQANAQKLLTNEGTSWRSAQKNVVMTGWTQAAPAAAGATGTTTKAANSQGNVSGQKTNTASATSAATAKASSAAKISGSQSPSAGTSATTNKAGAGSGGKTSTLSSAMQTLDAIFGTDSSGGSSGRSGAGGAGASKGASGANASKGASSGTNASKGSGTDQSASNSEGSSGSSGGIAGAASKVVSSIKGVFGKKNTSSDSSSEAGAKGGSKGVSKVGAKTVAEDTKGGAKEGAEDKKGEALPKGALGFATFADAKTNTKLLVYACGRKAAQVACVADLTNQNEQETLVQSSDVWKDVFIVDDRGDRHKRSQGYFMNIDGEQRQQIDINKGKTARFVLMFDGVPAKVQTITLRSSAGKLNITDIPLISQ